jgi:hypothetical protein
MYRCKMEKQTTSVKNVKTLMLPEPSDDNKRSPSLPQVQACNRPTPDKSMPTPGNKHLRHQLPRGSDAKMIHLALTDYTRETSSGTSSAMDSKFTTHLKLTWKPLLPL